MTTTILFIALSLGAAQPDKPVTDAEKKEFLEVLAKLPTKGEFFTDEGVTKAVPYTRVLLALSAKDLENRDLYGLLALSRGLLDRKEPRQYGMTHFESIAHPIIKLAWATMLLGDSDGPPEIVALLRGALDSKEHAQTLAALTGPGFEEFKDRVLLAHERTRQTRVELVKRHTISKDVVHLLWTDVLYSGNRLRMRCIDFDVRKRTWSHSREIFRPDQFVSSATDPTILQLEVESLHYLWTVDEGANHREATGLYYQAEADGKTEKLSNAHEYRAIAVGNLVVVCYTTADSPEKVFFRVVTTTVLSVL